jgi:hypothetical protein
VSEADLYQEAKAFRKSIEAGEVKAAPDDHEQAAARHEAENEIPF